MRKHGGSQVIQSPRLYMCSWASKAGGRGDASPAGPQSKNQREKSPRKDDILAPFFMTQMKTLHFPPFSK